MSAAQRCQGPRAHTAVGGGHKVELESGQGEETGRRERAKGEARWRESIPLGGGSLSAANVRIPKWTCVPEGWTVYHAHVETRSY